MKQRKMAWVAVGWFLVTALPGTPASAQEVSLDPRLGVVVPVGEMESFAGTGVAGGMGAGVRIHPRFGLRVDLEVENLAGVEVPGGADETLALGDVRVWRYTAGVEGDVIVPGLVPLTVVAGAGAGAASLRRDESASVPGESAALAEPSTFASARAGVRVGWDFSRRWNAFVSAEASALFTGDAADPEPASGILSGRGTLWAVPLTAGVRVRFY